MQQFTVKLRGTAEYGDNSLWVCNLQVNPNRNSYTFCIRHSHFISYLYGSIDWCGFNYNKMMYSYLGNFYNFTQFVFKYTTTELILHLSSIQALADVLS